MQLLILAGSYAGLFFLFGGKDAEPVPRHPRNWRRIKIIGVVIAGLAAIAGLSVAIILGHEYDRQRERTRRAKIEYEASKHRITSSEIDLIDLRLGPADTGWRVLSLLGESGIERHITARLILSR